MTAAAAGDRPADVTRDLSDLRYEFEALARIRAQQAELDEHEKHLAEKIKAALGDLGTVGTVDGRVVVTWREHTRTSFDSRSFKADQPELADKYSKTTTVRQFKIAEGPR